MTVKTLGDLNPGDRFHFGDRSEVMYVSVRESDQKLMEQEAAPSGDIVAFRYVRSNSLGAACASERVVFVEPRN